MTIAVDWKIKHQNKQTHKQTKHEDQWQFSCHPLCVNVLFISYNVSLLTVTRVEFLHRSICDTVEQNSYYDGDKPNIFWDDVILLCCGDIFLGSNIVLCGDGNSRSKVSTWYGGSHFCGISGTICCHSVC